MKVQFTWRYEHNIMMHVFNSFLLLLGDIVTHQNVDCNDEQFMQADPQFAIGM